MTLNSGSGGDSVGADDISSVKYPRGKLIHGIDGTNDGDVALTNPLPVAAVMRTDKVSDGTTTLVTPVITKIDITADGSLVALTASKKTRCLALNLNANATATFNIESGTGAGTQLTGLITMAANTFYILPYNPLGWFESASGEALYIDFTTAGQVSGTIVTVTV